MREVQRNTRWACHCGRFVRARGVTPVGYDCTRCGQQAGTAREVVVGATATVVDVLFATGGKGHVPVADGQEQLDYERVLGSPCAPLNCPDCGRFSADSWRSGVTTSGGEEVRRAGGVCSTHGRWSDST